MSLAKELEELSIFVRKETDIPTVNLIKWNEIQGLNAFIDHGSAEYENDGTILVNKVPVSITISDSIANWQRTLRYVEIIQREMRDKKQHKWNCQTYERVDDESNYVLKLNIQILLPIT